MDKQTEQKIRERAYELWMQHGGQPGRAEEYWYQAEREVLEQEGASGESGSHAVVGSDEQAPEQAPVEVSPAPLGMTSETLDDAPESPPAPKTRKRRSTVSSTPAEGGEPAEAPKRKRSARTST